jgi:hypothetical protein
MPPAEPAEDERRQWWWQRRPPADHSSFARGVWWAGHLQLPIALALLAVCLPLLVAASVPGQFLAGWFEGSGAGGFAWFGLAMSGPFALSGRMLRASSEWRIYWDPPTGARLPARLLGLGATVTGIAALSVFLTVVAVYVIFLVAAMISAFSR